MLIHDILLRTRCHSCIAALRVDGRSCHVAGHVCCWAALTDSQTWKLDPCRPLRQQAMHKGTIITLSTPQAASKERLRPADLEPDAVAQGALAEARALADLNEAINGAQAGFVSSCCRR